MNREQRKQAFYKRCQDLPEIITFSEVNMQHALEEMEKSSERRFEASWSIKLIASIAKETISFQVGNALAVTVTGTADDISEIPRDGCFKYSRPQGNGSLSGCSQRIRNGERITVALVSEDDLLIGYGIAVIREVESEIEIIDVDCYSRRESGFESPVEFADEVFSVGVGHVIVAALIKACKRPIKVDATNPNSRYVFKSLGFVHDADSNNPCILKLE